MFTGKLGGSGRRVAVRRSGGLERPCDLAEAGRELADRGGVLTAAALPETDAEVFIN